ESEKEASQQEFEETQQRVARRYKAECANIEKQWQVAQQQITAQFEADSKAAKQEYQTARNAAASALKADRSKADGQRDEIQAQVTEGIRRSKGIEREAADLLKAWHQERDYGELPDGGKPDRIYHDSLRQLKESLDTAEGHLEALKKLRVPNFFKGAKPY